MKASKLCIINNFWRGGMRLGNFFCGFCPSDIFCNHLALMMMSSACRGYHNPTRIIKQYISKSTCCGHHNPIRIIKQYISKSTCQCRGHKRLSFDPWVGKIPWRRKWATHSIILAWKIPWTEEPGWLQSRGWQRVRHDLATSHGEPRSHMPCGVARK